MPGAGASLIEVLQRGTLAARPAASAVATGSLWQATNYPIRPIDQSDGSAWNIYGPSGNPEVRAALTAPVSGDFAWVNQGSSSVRDDTDSFVLIGAGTTSGAANLVLRVKTAPATPYVITAYLVPMLLSKTFHGFGLAFRESGTGEIAVFDILAVGTDTQLLRSSKYTSATAFSADYVTTGAPWPIRWFRIADDGVDRICSVSADGVDWLEFHSVGRTDFLTADQVGLVISTENGATPDLAPIVRVQSWEES